MFTISTIIEALSKDDEEHLIPLITVGLLSCFRFEVKGN